MPEETSPKHREISRQLATEIAAGKHRAGDRLPSEAQLVQRFEVSRPTVARALRDLQDQGLIERRAGSGTYVRSGAGERPSSTFRQLGLLVPGLREIEIFDAICGELASLARVRDFGMLWGGSTRPQVEADMGVREAEELCDHFVEKAVSGVFFAPFEHRPDQGAANRRITEKLRQAGIPVVLLDRDIVGFPQRSSFDVVGIDNFAGGYLLGEHLIKLGAQRLAFVARPLSASTTEGRIAGAAAALAAHGRPHPRRFVYHGDPTDPKFVRSFATGGEVDAVICSNDRTAAELLQTLTRLRIAVPRQIRVVGFDDLRYATLLSVPLSTIHQPCRDLAVTAFHAMVERLSDPTLPPRLMLLTPRLVVRESCGAYLAR